LKKMNGKKLGKKVNLKMIMLSGFLFPELE
jgi:hypothetical protein